ncbi:MFS transporter [Rhodoferax sp.]|uniref:MFS transporter n=1 Tax=Rhodoferax sp. TaxID=50421 RepID=UPI002731D6E5|nr:MFS transporter [Rhodoferax sp.]MDP1529906.1 MFS transporter [Rhodoferax sp.]MDP1945784.1 MFS transporter [Rhodoferax sp.]MDP2442558.1 MFS transporter [Rhodoferax sp.]MDZ4206337.1 MFS transporter [Rhodoferax sp.]
MRQGLLSVFGSTLFQLSGIFMLSPLLLLLLKQAQVSTTVAGLFAATTWLGIFVVTPFASVITHTLGRRPTMWLASTLPMVAALGFLLTDVLWVWFALELMAGVAGGLRWVLAEAFIAEFAPPGKIGRYIGAYATMVGLTFVIGPALLAWVGPDNSHALWLVIALLAIGLAWTALIPPLPPDPDRHTASIGLAGLWRAVRAHPVIMLAGFLGGFFELGLASILPLYGLTLGLGASTAALLVSVSGMGGTLAALPAGMLADRFDSPAQGRRTLMAVCAALIFLSACASPWVGHAPWLIWPMVAIWGASGGALYTLAMVDIGSREKGMTLVNATAVLVLTYTLGGLIASSVSGAMLDVSLELGFPALLLTAAGIGLAALLKNRHKRLP